MHLLHVIKNKKIFAEIVKSCKNCFQNEIFPDFKYSTSNSTLPSQSLSAVTMLTDKISPIKMKQTNLPKDVSSAMQSMSADINLCHDAYIVMCHYLSPMYKQSCFMLFVFCRKSEAPDMQHNYSKNYFSVCMKYTRRFNNTRFQVSRTSDFHIHVHVHNDCTLFAGRPEHRTL